MTGIALLVLIALVLVLALQLGRLSGKTDSLSRRIAALESKADPQTIARNEPVSPPPPLPKPPPIPIVPPIARPPRPPIDWEQFLGVKLFAWLGGFALFIGIVFLVKYSFENNLVTPLGRIAIGGVIGLALIAIGWSLACGRYAVGGQSLCATGIVILYADLFAAHSFYRLISLTTAFFALAAVTLASFLLAVNLSAEVVVILGLLGGFLTPMLLPDFSNSASSLFLYIALLDLGVAAVALRKRWQHLVLLAAIGTALTQLRWTLHFFTSATRGSAFWIFLGFEALFLAIYFFRRGDDPPEKWTAAAAAVAGFTALAFCFRILETSGLARQPLFFFSFTFLADAGLLTLPVFGRAHRGIALGAGVITFALVAEWIARFAPQSPPGAALIAIVIFAILHAATIPASAWRPGKLPLTAAGTVTPFLLLIILIARIDFLNPTPVFLVGLVLAALLLGAAIVRRGDWLAAAALLGVGLMQLSWQGLRFSNEEALPTLLWDALFLILFVAYPFCSAEKDKAWSWAVSALAQALEFWLIDRVIVSALPNDRMGLLPAAFILPAALGVIALRKRYGADPASGDARLAWQGGALLLFVSLIFPLQFDREWITLGWALEGLALLWLFRRVPHRGLRLVAVLLLTAAFVRLALNPVVLEYHKRSAARIWNWYLYAYGITSVSLLAGARIFAGKRETPFERAAPAWLASLGTILLFLLLNIEIADYFSIGPTLTFSFSGNFARDMTYSIAWALFALGLIVAGMRMKERAARYAGVALLSMTLAKLFLHDLSDLDELYRIGAFVSVAVILIAASFIYQRFLLPARVTK